MADQQNIVDKEYLRDRILVAQRCQRNYDLSKEMPQEDLDLIEMSITQCPSKQNIAFYNAHMITDRAIIEKIHEYSAGLRANAKDENDTMTNPQVLGQLCIVFTTPAADRVPEEQMFDERTGNPRYRNAEQKLIQENLKLGTRDAKRAKKSLAADANVALGVAAGYSTLVASMLGYRSGCSSCLMNEPIKELLGIEEDVLLLMGIGFGDETRNRREHQLMPGFMFPSHTKEPIEVTWHK